MGTEFKLIDSAGCCQPTASAALSENIEVTFAFTKLELLCLCNSLSSALKLWYCRSFKVGLLSLGNYQLCPSAWRITGAEH
jgi:hypothetical protein